MTDRKTKPEKFAEDVVDSYKNLEQSFVDKFLEKDNRNPSGYSLKPGKFGEKVVSGYKKIENTVTSGYQNVEDTFVNGYKKVEDGFVNGFKKDDADERAKEE